MPKLFGTIYPYSSLSLDIEKKILSYLESTFLFSLFTINKCWLEVTKDELKGRCVTIITWSPSRSIQMQIDSEGFHSGLPSEGHSAIKIYKNGPENKGDYISFWPGKCRKNNQRRAHDLGLCHQDNSHFHSEDHDDLTMQGTEKKEIHLYGLDVDRLYEAYLAFKKANIPWGFHDRLDPPALFGINIYKKQTNCSGLVLHLLKAGGIRNLFHFRLHLAGAIRNGLGVALSCGTLIGMILYQTTLEFHRLRTNEVLPRDWITLFSYVIANCIAFLPTPFVAAFSKFLSDKYGMTYLTSTNFSMSTGIFIIHLLSYLVGINDFVYKFALMLDKQNEVLTGLVGASLFNAFFNRSNLLSYLSANSLAILFAHLCINKEGLIVNKRALLTCFTYYLAGYISTSLSPRLSILSFISNPNDVYKLVLDAAQHSEENKNANKVQIFLEKSRESTITRFFNQIAKNKWKVLASTVGIGVAAFKFFSLNREQSNSESIIPAIQSKGV